MDRDRAEDRGGDDERAAAVEPEGERERDAERGVGRGDAQAGEGRWQRIADPDGQRGDRDDRYRNVEGFKE